LLVFQPGPLLWCHQLSLPMDVGAPAQGKINHTGAHGGVAETVNQDEAACGPVFTVGINGDRFC